MPISKDEERALLDARVQASCGSWMAGAEVPCATGPPARSGCWRALQRL